MHKKLIRLSALAAGAVFLLAACGGGSASSASSGTNPTTTTGNAAGQQTAFRNCLSKHGVTLPAGFGNRNRNGGGTGGPPGAGTPGSTGNGAPGSFGGGANGQKSQKAFQACASLAPTGGFRGGRGGGGFNTQALTAYTSCLSDHGVKVTTTTPSSTPSSTPGGRGGVLRRLRSDPKFAAANKICRPLLPTFGSSSTTTTTAK